MACRPAFIETLRYDYVDTDVELWLFRTHLPGAVPPQVSPCPAQRI